MARENEKWEAIPEYEGLYKVSDRGRILRLSKWDGHGRYIPTEQEVRATDNGHGYKVVGLYKDGKRHNAYVHRLVALAFCKKGEGKDVVNHKDHDRGNNAASNLEWVTQEENVRYSSGLMRKRHKSNSATGERYISLRNGRYRITIDRKEYPTKATLEEAIEFRDMILRG